MKLELKHYFCTVYLFLWHYRLSYALCKGIFNYKPCCVGEIWNSTEEKCMPCPLGYFGENCTSLCNVPEYGYRCSSGKCKCNRVACKIESRECLTLPVTKKALERTNPYPSYMTQQVSSMMFYNSSTETFFRKTTIINATLSKNQTSLDKEGRIPYIIILNISGVILLCVVIGECVIVVRKKFCQGDLENDQPSFDPMYSVITIRNE